MWLHAPGSVLHLVFNMLSLWMFGSPLAAAWGAQRFLRFYLVCGVGAGLLIATLAGAAPSGSASRRATALPTLGASGAIYGVLLAYSLTWPDRTIMLLFPPIPFKAIWFIPFLFLMEVLIGPAEREPRRPPRRRAGRLDLCAAQMGLGGRASLGPAPLRWRRCRMRRQLRAVRRTRRGSDAGRDDDDHGVPLMDADDLRAEPRPRRGRSSRAAALLRERARSVALTGAGLSVESGIPPFRGPGGLWTKYGEPPLDGYQRFLRDPAKAWRERLAPDRELGARPRTRRSARAKPNAGHQALAELEAIGVLRRADHAEHRRPPPPGRHAARCSRSTATTRCCAASSCQHALRARGDRGGPGAACRRAVPSCGGMVKGDTVQFGEPIPPDVLRRLLRTPWSAPTACW